MTIIINPPPQNEKTPDFLKRLIDSVYTIFSAVGGQDGVPRLFRTEGTPAVNPGWATSSSVDMTAPDGYLEVYNKDGTLVQVPYWNK